MKKALAIALLFPLLTGLATASEDSDSNVPTCIVTKRIHTIRALDERHVIAEVRGGKRYVLGVEERCRGLENAVSFAVESSTTRICPDRFSELIFEEKSRRSDYCRIETVEELEATGNGDDETETEPGDPT